MNAPEAVAAKNKEKGLQKKMSPAHVSQEQVGGNTYPDRIPAPKVAVEQNHIPPRTNEEVENAIKDQIENAIKDQIEDILRTPSKERTSPSKEDVIATLKKFRLTVLPDFLVEKPELANHYTQEKLEQLSEEVGIEIATHVRKKYGTLEFSLGQHDLTLQQRIDLLPGLLNQIGELSPLIVNAAQQINDPQNIHRVDGLVLEFMQTFHDFMGTQLKPTLTDQEFRSTRKSIIRGTTENGQNATSCRGTGKILRKIFKQWPERILEFGPQSTQTLSTFLSDLSVFSKRLRHASRHIRGEGQLKETVAHFRLGEAEVLRAQLADIVVRPEGGECPPGHWTRLLAGISGSLAQNLAVVALSDAAKNAAGQERRDLEQNVLNALDADLVQHPDSYTHTKLGSDDRVLNNDLIPDLRQHVAQPVDQEDHQ